jgi:hypothetical protein
VEKALGRELGYLLGGWEMDVVCEACGRKGIGKWGGREFVIRIGKELTPEEQVEMRRRLNAVNN